MPTLYVENVPKDLYEALRARAKKRRSSIAAETIAILRERVPTKAQLKDRQALYGRFLALQRQPSPGGGPFPSTEEMARDDREERDRRSPC